MRVEDFVLGRGVVQIDRDRDLLVGLGVLAGVGAGVFGLGHDEIFESPKLDSAQQQADNNEQKNSNGCENP